MGKPSIKQFCICFSKHKRAVQRDTVKFLLSCLKIALRQKSWREVARIKEELKLICLKESMGLLIRSKYNQNAEEEKASLYHAARESKNSRNNIESLKINGVIVKDKVLSPVFLLLFSTGIMTLLSITLVLLLLLIIVT